MPYRFLEDVAIADVAFEAWADTAEGMFAAAGEATLNVMVRNLDAVSAVERRSIQVDSDAMDMLLLNFLQEIIFFKDAERLLLQPREVRITQSGEEFTASADLVGEELDMDRHELIVDVKAVTMHRFQVEQTEGGWRAFVVLDI